MLSPPLSPTSAAGQAEVTLDIEMVIGMVPKAEVLVYIGSGTSFRSQLLLKSHLKIKPKL